MLKIRLVFVCSLIALSVSTSSFGSGIRYSKESIEAESMKIKKMVEARDIAGLIAVLNDGIFPAKEIAAAHLGEIGDESALPALQKLNANNGGWHFRSTADRRSGVFPVAVCKIMTKDKSQKEKVEALFDLLEGRGPAVPESAKFTEMTINGVTRKIENPLLKNNSFLGSRVALELDKYVTPEIIKRLRRSINRGTAIEAVWMEVREMPVKDAIARCVQIARDEEIPQRYGAIMTLKKFGEDAIDALDTLAREGHRDAIEVLGFMRNNPKVFDILCNHLSNNNNEYVRAQAVSWVAFATAKDLKLKSIQNLMRALYDPSTSIQRRAASYMNSYAHTVYKSYYDQVKHSLLTAAIKHPDQKVRKEMTAVAAKLGYDLPQDWTGEIPKIRTDLSPRGWIPKTPKQKLKDKTAPLEKQGLELMEKGPAVDAVKLYQQLLKLRPGHEPYQQALAKAKAYAKAAEDTTEHWYPDAPYSGCKGRYSYYLTSEVEGTKELKEKFELAHMLSTTGYMDFNSNPFSKEAKPRDKYLKALRLFEHIVKHYPENEYLVLRSKEAIGGLKLNLFKDIESYVLVYVDFFNLDIKKIVDSTYQSRNKVLDSGLTQAQLDFENFYLDVSRKYLIDLSVSHAGHLKAAGKTDGNFLDEIIRRCAKADPTIVEMAKVAKAKMESQGRQSH